MYSELIGNYKKHRIKSLCDNKLTIASPSNMLRQLSTNVKEVGMMLGQLFIPALEYTLPVINGVTLAIKQLLASMADLLGITINFEGFGKGVDQTGEDMSNLTDEMEDANKALEEYKNQAMGFDEINPIKDVNASVNVNGSVGSSIDLTDEILKATEEYEKAWQEVYDRMENRSQNIADRIVKGFKSSFRKAGWGGVGQHISDSIASSLNSADWESVNARMTTIATNIASFLNGLITPELLGAVGTTFAQTLNTVINAKATLGENINFDQVGEAIATGINDFFDTFDFERLGESINTWVQGLVDALVVAIKKIEWTDVIGGLSDLVTSLDTDTIAILLGLNILRKNGGLSSIFGFGGGGTGGTGGGAGLFGIGNFLWGNKSAQSGGGLTIGNTGLFGTLTASVLAASLGGNIGSVLGALLSDDAELYLQYDLKEATLYIAKALMQDPEEVKDAFIQVVDDIAHKVDDTTYDITKPLFEGLDNIFWFSAKHDKDWQDLGDALTGGIFKNWLTEKKYKDIEEENAVRGSGGGRVAPYINNELIDKWARLVVGKYAPTKTVAGAKGGQGVTDEEWANFFENQIPQIYKEEAVKLGVKWEVGGKTIDFLNIGTEAETAGGKIVDGLSTGITSKDSATTSIAKSMGSIASKMVEIYGTLSGKAKTQGSGIIWNLGQGIIKSDSAKTAIGTMASGITSTLGSKYNTIKSDVSSKGKGLVWNLGQGIKNSDSATTAFTNLFTALSKIANKDEVKTDFVTAGKNIIEGLVKGLKDPKTLLNLATTVAGLGGMVSDIFKGLLDINSPSGLFEEYAMYTIQGYNLGIEKYAPTTVDTMEDWESMITDASMTLEPQCLGNANSEEILLLRQQNMLLQALLNKEAVEIKGDAKQIFKVVQKQANNYTIQTGEPAFI